MVRLEKDALERERGLVEELERVRRGGDGGEEI